MNRTAVALLAVGLTLTAAGCDTSDASSSGDKLGKPDVKVDAAKILKDFKNNEAAADGKYKDKTLQVSGVVDKVDTELLDDEKYSVQIGGGTQFEVFTVNCNGQSSNDVAKIKKGDKITVIGQFDDGGDLGVELKPCEIQ